jgi:hypothetical protein
MSATAQDQKSDFKAVISINGQTREFTDPESAKKAFKELGLPDPFDQLNGIGAFGPQEPPDPLEKEPGVVIKITDKKLAELWKKLAVASTKASNKPVKWDFDLTLGDDETEVVFFNEVDHKPCQAWLKKWLAKQARLVRTKNIPKDAHVFLGDKTVVFPAVSAKEAGELTQAIESALNRTGTLADDADRGEALIRVLIQKEQVVVIFPADADFKRARPIASTWDEANPKKKAGFPGLLGQGMPGGPFNIQVFGGGNGFGNNPLNDRIKKQQEKAKKRTEPKKAKPGAKHAEKNPDPADKD